MPKVSFILPAYKRRFLHEAIASILAQTYRDFELVIVDDCSPEDLKSVVNEFHDARLSYHRNEMNIGGKDLVASWNHAMEYARGEFAVIASDDDIYHVDFLREMMQLAEKYPTCDLFHCRIVSIDQTGKWICVGDPRPEYETPVEMFYNTAVSRIAVRAPDIMFRVAALKDIGGFFQSPQAWYTDIGTWVRLGMKNGGCCSPRILFYWRESGLNISSRHEDAMLKIEAGLQFINIAREWVKELKPKNSLDEFLLKKIPNGLVWPNYRIMRYVVRRSSLRVWLHVLMSSKLPLDLKLRFMLDRIRKVS